MRRGGVPPTRHNLLRAKRRLEQVQKGTGLLTQKREALVGELFRLAGPAVDAREAMAGRAEAAYPILLRALAVHGEAGLEALGWPRRQLEVELRQGKVWGIGVSEIVDRGPVRRSLQTRGTPPASTGPAAAAAADEFESMVELLLDAASRETLIRRLGRALADTSRQLNTLEQRLAPDLEERITRIRRVLDEREREEHVRVKHLLRRRSGRRLP